METKRKLLLCIVQQFFVLVLALLLFIVVVVVGRILFSLDRFGRCIFRGIKMRCAPFIFRHCSIMAHASHRILSVCAAVLFCPNALHPPLSPFASYALCQQTIVFVHLPFSGGPRLGLVHRVHFYFHQRNMAGSRCALRTLSHWYSSEFTMFDEQVKLSLYKHNYDIHPKLLTRNKAATPMRATAS